MNGDQGRDKMQGRKINSETKNVPGPPIYGGKRAKYKATGQETRDNCRLVYEMCIRDRASANGNLYENEICIRLWWL